MTPDLPAGNADVPAGSADLAAIHAAVLAWYAANGRPLAFRATRDPWAILVSEAMAQQTQAERAAEAWTRFMTEFPTVEALAAATPAAVLRAWRGEDIAALRSLPGVGPYTARAVAALAFGQPQAAVDTNVARVLGRALGAEAEGEPVDRAALQRLADAALPPADPGAWTHALMDIGATVCRIRTPRCEECPLMPWCRFAIATAARGPAAAAPGPRARVDRRAGPRARPPGTRVGSGGRPAATPFPATNRWLRGRILDRLRDAPEGGWLTIEAPMGSHDGPAVVAAIEALAVERLLEVRRTGTSFEARLPVA